MTTLKRCKTCARFYPTPTYHCPTCLLMTWLRPLSWWQRLWVILWVLWQVGHALPAEASGEPVEIIEKE